MKKKFFYLFIYLIGFIYSNNKNKMSRFERLIKECSQTIQCSNRSNDDDCIYKCLNKECYEEIIEKNNILIEYGEVNLELKKKFEKCFNEKKRNENLYKFNKNNIN
jgi:hypothetical protein